MAPVLAYFSLGFVALLLAAVTYIRVRSLARRRAPHPVKNILRPSCLFSAGGCCALSRFGRVHLSTLPHSSSRAYPSKKHPARYAGRSGRCCALPRFGRVHLSTLPCSSSRAYPSKKHPARITVGGNLHLKAGFGTLFVDQCRLKAIIPPFGLHNIVSLRES